MRKAKNVILKAITGAAVVLFLLSACALDSESMAPAWVCIGCAGWLALFAAANGER